jgi:hypothetical protein
MIPPVWTIPVWDRAQSSPVQQDGRTGLDRRLPVLDWTGSVWTGPCGWCGGKIYFSAPPPHSLAGGSRRGAYGDTGILEMDSAMGSIYLGDTGADRHHLIIQRNTHSIFPSSWSHALLSSIHRSTQFVWFVMHSCAAFIDPPKLCAFLHLGSLSHPLTLFLPSSSQHRSVSWIPFGCRERWGGLLMMGSLPSSSAVSPQRVLINIKLVTLYV